jgi:hypothetical protein
MMFANRRVRAIEDFEGDPTFRYRAGSLFTFLWRTAQSVYTAPYRSADDNPNGGVFYGTTAPVQAFTGSAFLAANHVQYSDGGYPTIDTGLIEGPMGDPARRIFAERLARRKGSM